MRKNIDMQFHVVLKLVKSVIVVATICSNILVTGATPYFATVTSVADGDWHVGATWSTGNPPSSTDDVVITHRVDINGTTGNTTIKSILITNTTTGKNARLQVFDGVTLNVTGSVDIIATDANQYVAFDVFDGASTNTTVNIGGSLIYVDNNSNDQSTRLSIDGSSDVNVGVDFSYTRNVNPTGVQDSRNEINIGATAGSTATFDVTGNITLTYDAGGSGSTGGNLSFDVGNDAAITGNNLTLNVLDAPSNTLVKSDLLVRLNDSASMTITGSTTMNHNSSTVNSGQEIKIELNSGDATGTASFETNNFTMNSTTITNTTNNTIIADGSSSFTVNGDLGFTTSDVQFANNIELVGTANFNLYGTVSGVNDGRIEFTSYDATLNMLGIDNQVLPEARNDNYGNLIFNNTASPTGVITANDNVIVNGDFTLTQGILDLNASRILTIEDTGTISTGNTSSYVQNGDVIVIGNTPTSYTIPVGAGGNFAPIDIANVTGGGTTTTITVSYSGTPPLDQTVIGGNIDHVSNKEYWNVSGTNITTADISLNWSSDTFSGINDTSTGGSQDLFIAGYDGADWSNIGGTITDTGTSGYVSLVGYDFSSFALTFMSKNGLNALPVELVMFEATIANAKTILQWSTSSESNNDYFIVEKSKEGQQFSKIGRVDGAGTTSTESTYEFSDNNPYSQLSYYRLKQIDIDENFKYSKAISVYNDVPFWHEMLKVFPNPIKENTFVLLLDKDLEDIDGAFTVLIYDVKGTLVHEKIINNCNVDNEIIMNTSDFGSDITKYMLLRMVGEKSVFVKKIYIDY